MLVQKWILVKGRGIDVTCIVGIRIGPPVLDIGGVQTWRSRIIASNVAFIFVFGRQRHGWTVYVESAIHHVLIIVAFITSWKVLVSSNSCQSYAQRCSCNGSFRNA